MYGKGNWIFDLPVHYLYPFTGLNHAIRRQHIKLILLANVTHKVVVLVVASSTRCQHYEVNSPNVWERKLDFLTYLYLFPFWSTGYRIFPSGGVSSLCLLKNIRLL